ncbi:hypothetical protein L861_19550 [Litchfieldella anticariensis FP35 = DSM 16096]|uniref:DUF2252 domain-containing protein n=1 Tax=Litchfieldella anticariensis (strain DSM 16096 / CECT 5854 / CIP 108499 / LMG 22089 / FP35) TaxID=1121939 RepID=S2KMZ5_LITA3|nr:DUF2252 family protein [Halomonas anticariensis]EPC01848.1 hypothetical protein L861_19550 [Halomonas anticariensis FP35 = DSM 16096]
MSQPLTHHNRPRQVLDAIDTANAHLSETDRAVKFAKLAASPYRFFRGTNHLYWDDVWHDWRFALFGGLPNTQTWLQGDAHAYNFGAYGHHDDSIRYGMDDFDDAMIGDYQYDVWRLAISLVLDARENVGLSRKGIRKALKALLESYHDELAGHVRGEVPGAVTLESAKEPLKPFLEKVSRQHSRARMLDKWTRLTDDGRCFAERPDKLAGLPAHLASQLHKAIENEYRQSLRGTVAEAEEHHFRVKDMARRLDAGTGSLGLERYYVLIEGGHDQEHDDVILDVKEQTSPEAWRLMSREEKRAWRRAFPHEGIRHAAAFHAIAEHPDIYLGWLHLGDKVFSVRERSPFKEDFPTHKLDGAKPYRRLVKRWGRILAREHLRGARALHQDDPARFARSVCARLDGRLEHFIDVVSTLSVSYADCVAQDYRTFVDARIAKR